MKQRVGIVGYGRIAESAHMPAWCSLPGVRVVALADYSPDRRALAGAAAKNAQVYRSCAEMLAGERLDCVDICTPPYDHVPSILAACAAGIPRIVCEKPLTASAAEFAVIEAACAASGSQVYTINSWLQSDLHRVVSQCLASGQIGEIQHVTLRTLRPDCAIGVPSWLPRWRTDPTYAGGGIVLDHGWHQLYLMARWIGAEPMGVRASLATANPIHAPVEDVATLDIEFPAATGRIELSWAADGRSNDGEIIGSLGSLAIRDDGLRITTQAGETWHPYGERLSDSSYHPEWFRALFARILEDVGRVEGQQNLKEAGMLLRTLFAAYERTAFPRWQPTTSLVGLRPA